MSHPYSALADYAFWGRAVTGPAPGHIDPVVRAFRIEAQDKLSTMGSCFAQHLSRFIANSGLNFFVPEKAPEDFSPSQAWRQNYGVFSARYGNIYTVRQALQLFERAYGGFAPQEDVWRRGDVFVDPFRPMVEPDGFADRDALVNDREKHLQHVRTVFSQSDVLVFTLGLTEAWRSKVDGAVFSLAPGVAGGDFDPERHEFVNFSVADVRSDLFLLIHKLIEVNPSLKIILTVSPVPLIATYEQRHVLVSTAVSKSVLRVAADEAEKHFENVFYFPSYELITSPAAGHYFDDDLRQVRDIGVGHVMRIFRKHYFANAEIRSQSVPNVSSGVDASQDIICDESVIESAIRQSGFRS